MCSSRQKGKAKPTEPMEMLLSEVMVCKVTRRDSFGLTVLSMPPSEFLLLEMHSSEAHLEIKTKMWIYPFKFCSHFSAEKVSAFEDHPTYFIHVR